MSYLFYKILHLSSLTTLFLSLGMLIMNRSRYKKWVLSLHGLCLILLFVSGFGLLAKLGIHPKMASLPLQPLLRSAVWAAPLLLYVLLFKKIKLSINPQYSIFKPLFLLIFSYMFIFEISKIITPDWIGLKITSWLAFAFGAPVLLSKQDGRSGPRVLIISLLLIFLIYFTVHHAVYKT